MSKRGEATPMRPTKWRSRHHMFMHILGICPPTLMDMVSACLSVVDVIRTVDDACLYLALFRSGSLSLRYVLNRGPPALESLGPLNVKESVDASDVSVGVCEPPTLDHAPAETDGRVEPPP